MPEEKQNPPDRDQAMSQQQPGTQQQGQQDAGTAQGGEIKDKEAETSNSYGNTRDSGERPK